MWLSAGNDFIHEDKEKAIAKANNSFNKTIWQISNRFGFEYKKNKKIKVILSSGYTDKKSQWEIIKNRGIRFLQKPYSLISLLQAVREVLDGKETKAAR